MQRPPPQPWPYRCGGDNSGGGGFSQPVCFIPNFNVQFPGNLQYLLQPPSLPHPVFESPSFVQPQNPRIRTHGFSTQMPSFNPPMTLEMVESAAAKAHANIVSAGENVSAWKVSQSAVIALKVDSWSSLGFQLQDVPTLRRLLLTEGKVNAFIHCFVGARKITSVYELEVELCKNEGIDMFEELGLGPFLRHPLVKHYFSVASESTEVFKITSEEIILFLQTFMRTCKKVHAEEFLSFVAKQKSLPVKEKLGVRIHSLGLHVQHILEASKAENTLLREKFNRPSAVSLKNVVDKKSKSQPIRIFTEKKFLDDRFHYISNRVKHFSSVWNDDSSKHVYCNSSDEGNVSQEDDDDEDDGEDCASNKKYQNFSSDKGSGQRVSSCPYPSKTEEMMRLGLNPGNSEKESPAIGRVIGKENSKSSVRKRKLVEKNSNASSSCKFLKKVDASELEAEQHLIDIDLGTGETEKFVATWKEACRGHSVAEVLDMMLNFYVEGGKRSKRMRNLYSSYPFVGLLNVAVMSIKCGMLESLYDAFQDLSGEVLITTDSADPAEMIDVRPTVEDSIRPYSVSVDYIVKKIASYFENNHISPSKTGLPLEKQFASFKKLCDCEIWLMAQFNVQEFSSLGHGSFYDFLENYISTLPNEVHAVFSKVYCRGSLEVRLLEQQLGIMLSQAESNLMVKDKKSKFDIVALLRKQFPTISFSLIGEYADNFCEDVIDRHKELCYSSCLLFSSCLLGDKCNQNLLACKEISSLDVTWMEADVPQRDSCARTSKDAFDCLLKAPMLSDLLYWSHWNLLYASSLGPLPEWLLKANHKELLCIATVDGKVIRIDHSATADEFLEGLVSCSPFQVALKFLSLLCLYRGTGNAPLALLKCYAQRAVDVIVRNFSGSLEVNVGVKNSVPGQTALGTGISSSPLFTDSVEHFDPVSQPSISHAGFCRVNNPISVISRTMLKSLMYLPIEFRSFAAEILLSGLQFVTKKAPVVILKECAQIDERVMLHDIGLSLGVTDWVIDYNDFSSLPIVDLSITSEILKGCAYSSHLASVFDQKITSLSSEQSISANHKMPFGIMADALLIDENCQSSSRVNGRSIDDILTSDITKDSGEIDEKQALCEATSGSIDTFKEQALLDAAAIVKSIRCEEFGLGSDSNQSEDDLMKKQHARLGRALHCLSQELYSEDSHFLLELVQNADDNMYLDNIVPQLVFILQENSLVVLNNERGFSAENIRALCDIGNSTKKGSSAGYIGKKGIGFKSVFRVTDAPEIHSNGFHVKFDITEGQIGFVLPTIVPPCDVNSFTELLCGEDSLGGEWNTCIILPFRFEVREGAGINSIIAMLSDLHPSLLLFLHRLQCIKFRNLLNDTLVIMRKEILRDGIVRVFHGDDVMSWLVSSKTLKSSAIRSDVETTDISIAFTLQESHDGEYKPYLSHQPVFAFLPLRNYGMKFILQGDFVLPSSREEVDADSAWNQWLLSEFPALFVMGEQSFCSLPCFLEKPGKAVTAYMSFVPLIGEVHGFFSHLPHMIISLLRKSKCLLPDSLDLSWILPCRVLRGWNEQVRLLLSDLLLQRHIGLVYLHKDIKLTDTLSRALGIREYGPKILVEVISSICQFPDGIDSLGLDWLSSWLCAIYSSLSVYSSGFSSLNAEIEHEIINDLKNIPFIPLSDGTYGSVADGPIWLPCDAIIGGSESKYHAKDFPCLYGKLKIVTSHLFSLGTINSYTLEEIKVDKLMQILLKLGVQKLSEHEIIRSHILLALSDKHNAENGDLMIEYLAFIMLHLQLDCARCLSDKSDLLLELRNKPVILTNHGYKCPVHEPIHFSREYGNPIDIRLLFDVVDIKWAEVDEAYLKHPSTQSLSSGLLKWRGFFLDLGVTDFVQVTFINKAVENVLYEDSIKNGNLVSATSYVEDWESPELVNLLSIFSSKRCRAKCMYLLEVLDRMWDDCYSAKARGYIIPKTDDAKKPILSSFMQSIHEFAWIASTIDKELHHPKKLFYDCEQVRSVLGSMGAYAVPQVNSKVLAKDIGFKIEVSFDDVLEFIQLWTKSGPPFVASTAQMSKFYNFISDVISPVESMVITELMSSSFIFVPFISNCRGNVPASGMFFSSKEVYWQDPTGCVDKIMELVQFSPLKNERNRILCQALAAVYPTHHDFFVNVCGVRVTPPFDSYLQILLQLAAITSPSQAAHEVFRVIAKWADDMKSGIATPDEISEMKVKLYKLENAVLPTVQDKWVSIHPSFSLLCWPDDEELINQFKHSDSINVIQFGVLSMEEKSMLSGPVANFLHIIGIPPISEIVLREAIFYGTEDNRKKISLLNWVIPFAQRYIYKLHPDTYFKLKQAGFAKLSQLQVVVVTKLFYKYTLQGLDCTSKRRFECNCLLQGNILYACQTADAHSLFLELSRLFFDGSAELHFANFLHMVTTMAESGTTSEQIEFFIFNSQKVPKLPKEEALWSLSSMHGFDNPTVAQSTPACAPCMNLENSFAIASLRKSDPSSNWPPTDWKTAPDFHFSLASNLRLEKTPYDCAQNDVNKATETVTHMEYPVSVEVTGEWNLEEASIELQGSVDMQGNFASEPSNLSEDHGVVARRTGSTNPAKSFERDRISWRIPDPYQIRQTGRLGEMIAYKHFADRHGSSNVKWVNEETESGLPYDLVINVGESREYIEVKATVSATKDWFDITVREWNFAVESSDSYSIAHVAILGQNKATVTLLKNPYKLCHQNTLSLALLMSRRVRY